jgi:hypothetical protein
MAQVQSQFAVAVPTGAGQADGLMTHEDKAKLDGIEAGADVNQLVFHGFEGRTGSSLSIADAILFLAVPTAQSVWLNGREYALTEGLSLDLGETPADGAHYIVAQDDEAGALELAELPGAWSITETSYTPVAYVYWQGGGGAVLDERHGHNRNLEQHAYLHYTVGARIQNDGSFAQTQPTTANDGKLELVAGSLWDEDIENEITTAQGKLVRNWYETASGVWTWGNGADNGGYDRPYIWNSDTSRLRYPSTASAYALTDCADNRFIAVWVYASNDVDRPIYVVTPALAATYTTVANARAALAPVLPFAPELKLLYRWIYRGDGEYQEAADYRTASSLPSGGVSAPVAASVTFSPSGTIVATNVQAAIEEVASEALPASGGTLTNVSETIAYQEVTDATVTVSFATGDVQYLYINPAGASVEITLPADPGAVSKAGILFVKNNTGKAHTWAAGPAVRFVDQTDADTVPTPAAVGYYTRYTCQWMDNNAGTGAWWVTVAGRDTA